MAGLASAGSASARTHDTPRRRTDWVATLMVSLVFALHALPHAKAEPLPVVGPFVLAGLAFVLLLIVEPRVETPLVDLTFFAQPRFVMGVAIGSLSMFSIMSLLLYFNLYAQGWEGTKGHNAGGRRLAAPTERISAHVTQSGAALPRWMPIERAPGVNIYFNIIEFEATPVQGGTLCANGKWRAIDGSATGTTPFRMFFKNGSFRRAP